MSTVAELEKQLATARKAHLLVLSADRSEPLLRKRVQALKVALAKAQEAEGKNVPTKEGQQSKRKLAGGKV